MLVESSHGKVLRDGERIAGIGIYLRLTELSDCGDSYLAWLKDPEVNRFLETRWTDQTLATIREFVARMRASPDNYLFAIVQSGTDRHLGNIKLGPINPVHFNCEVSYFVGDRAMWGKGVATEAIRLATQFAFERLHLHRVQAGLYAENLGSAKALERAGFTREGTLQEKFRLADRWSDQIIYGIVRAKQA